MLVEEVEIIIIGFNQQGGGGLNVSYLVKKESRMLTPSHSVLLQSRTNDQNFYQFSTKFSIGVRYR